MTYRSDVDQEWINRYYVDRSFDSSHDSLSGWSSFSPSSALVEKAAKRVHLNGVPLGDVVTGSQYGGSSAVAFAIIAGAVALGAVLNYQVGKAMAPSAAKRKKWGWIGVPVGFVPFGTPIMAIIANHEKG